MEVAIQSLDIIDDVRLSWQQLLEKAITEPGVLHGAYRRFWNYSLGNQILALVQCHARGIEPGPLASFYRWSELGRHVKKGEKAITLCMPIRVKCQDWDERRRDAGMVDGTGETEFGYRTMFVYKKHWFVLSQTEGDPYEPEPVPNWSKERAMQVLNIQDEPFDLIDGNTQGYAIPNKRVVAVSPLAALPHKTLFHEMAHILLDTWQAEEMSSNHPVPRSIEEVEAEAVALICCDSLGLEGPEFSRAYIQQWLGDGRISPRSAQRIFQAAERILKAGSESDSRTHRE